LEIKGLLAGEGAPVKDEEFADAFAKGLLRFARLLGAKKVVTSPIKPARLRQHIDAVLRRSL
jgi:hypothetical protein